MSFNWAEFNVLAQELIGHPGLNASAAAICRTAISRAYYAAFCTAMERLVNVDHVHIDQTADAHVQIYNEYWQSSDVRHRQIAAHLKTLRAQRNTADYDPAPAQVFDTFTAHESVLPPPAPVGWLALWLRRMPGAGTTMSNSGTGRSR